MCFKYHIMPEGSVSSVIFMFVIFIEGPSDRAWHTNTHSLQQLSKVFFLLFLSNYRVSFLRLTSQWWQDNTLFATLLSSQWTEERKISEIRQCFLDKMTFINILTNSIISRLFKAFSHQAYLECPVLIAIKLNHYVLRLYTYFHWKIY